jgi:hypothetical protein
VSRRPGRGAVRYLPIPATAKNLCVVLFSDATGGTTDNISIAEFQLTQGPDIVDYVATPLAHELIRCQRRFCKSFPLNVVPAAGLSEATAGSGAVGMIGKAGALALAANYGIQFPGPDVEGPDGHVFYADCRGSSVLAIQRRGGSGTDGHGLAYKFRHRSRSCRDGYRRCRRRGRRPCGLPFYCGCRVRDMTLPQIIANAPDDARVSIFWKKGKTSGESIFPLKDLKAVMLHAPQLNVVKGVRRCCICQIDHAGDAHYCGRCGKDLVTIV